MWFYLIIGYIFILKTGRDGYLYLIVNLSVDKVTPSGLVTRG